MHIIYDVVILQCCNMNKNFGVDGFTSPGRERSGVQSSQSVWTNLTPCHVQVFTLLSVLHELYYSIRPI